MQTLILWAVVAHGGEAAQKDLKPALLKPDRDALTRAGLIATQRGPRGAVRVEVTDRGWAWVAANTHAALPARTTAAAVVLFGLLGRLGAYAAAHGVALAEIIRPSKTDLQPAVVSARANGVAGRIRDAYLEASGGATRRQIRLSEVRRRLSGVSRPDQDAALLAMIRDGSGDLLRLEDPRQISAEDRDAALAVGGDARHLLWID